MEAVRIRIGLQKVPSIATRMPPSSDSSRHSSTNSRLTTQKSFYVEISRARDRAELVTDDKAALKEQLEAATGERIAALEAVEADRAKGREAGADAGRSAEREGGLSRSRDPDRVSEPAMEQSRGSKGVDRDLGL